MEKVIDNLRSTNNRGEALFVTTNSNNENIK